MSKFAVVLPAAGNSTRFESKNNRKKTFIELKGRPIWLRAAECFVNRNDVIQTIIVVSPNDIKWFKDKFRPNLAFMNIDIVEGGASRTESVQNGLSVVNTDADFIAVHDAARPLITNQWVDEVFKMAEKTDAAIPAIPIPGTIKRVNDQQFIEETVSRENLWQAQTPQVFARDLLLKAYSQRGEDIATDEAQLVERTGHAVSVVLGSPMNFKITTTDDFKMAEAVLEHLPKSKGIQSLHPFADDPPSLLDL